MAARQDDYYYAEGRRVPLRPDASVAAVVVDRAREAGLAQGLLERIEREAEPLRGGVVMLEAGRLPVEARSALERAGALLPVFEVAGARLVVVPEVRVEAAEEAMRAVRSLLSEHGVPPDAIREEGGRLTVTPGSGRDALHLANAIHERVRPPLAQARFLRIIPRPGKRAK